ncbi:MAG TPA: histidine kinase dimerization/phospho-acceptor domain-containing protein [Solirubrobacteraceae bacterium]|nr:histidine kinase dimerization/phospho-acceptor domain-containing protein [Solirubrobacteraceae bacterium]
MRPHRGSPHDDAAHPARQSSGTTGQDPLRKLVHDLRAPLTVAQGFADLLVQRGDALPAEQRAEFARRIADAMGEMRRILDDAP